jgi:hypothetical protein
MKLREGPSDALLDKIIGSDRIVRQTSGIPPKVGQGGFDIPVQRVVAAPDSSSKAALLLGINGTVVSRPGISS